MSHLEIPIHITLLAFLEKCECIFKPTFSLKSTLTKGKENTDKLEKSWAKVYLWMKINADLHLGVNVHRVMFEKKKKKRVCLWLKLNVKLMNHLNFLIPILVEKGFCVTAKVARNSRACVRSIPGSDYCLCRHGYHRADSDPPSTACTSEWRNDITL